MDRDGLLQAVRDAHAEALRLVEEQRLASAERDGWVRQCHTAGVSVAELARELGVDRQRVYAMLK